MNSNRQNTLEYVGLTSENQYNARFLFLYGLGSLLLLCLMHIYILLFEPSSWIAWLAAVIYLVFVYFSYQKTPIFFWLLFLFYFGQGSSIISCAYLEGGHYIIEQATYAYATGATLRLVIYNMIFFLSGLVFFSFLKVKLTVNKKLIQDITTQNKRYLFIIMAVLLTILYVGFYYYGVPLFMGLDRFDYWADHPLPILKSFGGQVYFMMFLFGLMYSKKKDWKILVFLCVTFIFLILSSEKFTGLYSLLFYFVLPIIINGLVQGKGQIPLKRIGFYVAVLGSLFLGLIYYHYSYINISNTESAAEAVLNRALGLQGHVWWGTDVEVKQREKLVDIEQFSKEFSSFMSYSSDKEDVGMKYLIALLAPPRIANSFLERGVNFTMGYPAIGLYIFNYIGLIFLQIIVAGIVVLTVVYLYNKLTMFQLIRSALAFKIFIEVYASFTIGNFYQLYSLKILMYIIIALVIESIAIFGKTNKIKQQEYHTEI